MPRYILINETTRCAKPVLPDEIRNLIDIRTNPEGGYTDVDRCMTMITNPEGGTYMPFPLRFRGHQYTIHVQGRMDFANNLKWQPADHECSAACVPAKRRTPNGLAPGQAEIMRRIRGR